jgi:hypothetical protein
MKRKVKSKEALLELFKEQEYTENNVDWCKGEFIFADTMFNFCGEETLFAESEDPIYSLETKIGGWSFIEDWLEPLATKEIPFKGVDGMWDKALEEDSIEEDVDFSVSSLSQDRFGPVKEEWTDKHYDNKYYFTPEDIERGYIKLDPYWLSLQLKLGVKDPSCIIWHSFKTICRFGEKNDKLREAKALLAQAKRLVELYS